MGMSPVKRAQNSVRLRLTNCPTNSNLLISFEFLEVTRLQSALYASITMATPRQARLRELIDAINDLD